VPKTPLSLDLEYSLLHAIITGQAPPEIVEPTELSQRGQLVLAATQLLESPPPHEPRAVYLAATEVLGGDRDALKLHVERSMLAGAGTSAADIVAMVRDKQLLVELINTASDQLRAGRLDVGAITHLVSREVRGELAPVADLLRGGLPPAPRGIPMASLPAFSERTGGIYGLWAIAGEPAVGKSTLAWQLSLDVANGGISVLYFDFENGLPVLLDRTARIFGGDVARIRNATARLFVRDSIRFLDGDLNKLPPPALVVVDSVQKLPSSSAHRREGLDAWVHRLEGLKRRGYTVLLVSEVPRSVYESEPGIGDFKETGEIEYSADLGVRALPAPDNGIDLWIVKNRHHPYRGYAGALTRERDFLFRETGG